MKENQKHSKKGIIIIVIAIVAIFIVAILIYIKLGTNTIPNGEFDIPKSTETTYIEYPDVDKYFEENADIVSIVPVNESSDIMTEQEVIRELKKRGFSDISVTTTYAMNGEYYEEKEISEQSDDKHPMYEARYLSSNGDLWTITIINNQIIASPISYQIQSELTQSIVLSEQETITSYDSLWNRYFITIPNDDSMTVKVVNSIDAQTLDSSTAEEIEKL